MEEAGSGRESAHVQCRSDPCGRRESGKQEWAGGAPDRLAADISTNPVGAPEQALPTRESPLGRNGQDLIPPACLAIGWSAQERET